MRLVEFLILALAVWRIVRLVQYERGPLALFTRMRKGFDIGHGEDGEPVSWPDTEMGKLLACLDCGSIWIGVGMAGLYLWQPILVLAVALPFALSAAAIAMGVMIDGQSRQ